MPAASLDPNATNPLGLDPLWLASAYYGSLAKESEAAADREADPNSEPTARARRPEASLWRVAWRRRLAGLGWSCRGVSSSGSSGRGSKCVEPALAAAWPDLISHHPPPASPADPEVPATAAMGSLESYLCECWPLHCTCALAYRCLLWPCHVVRLAV